jgi:UDP-N-acetylmuramate dehydrogenase
MMPRRADDGGVTPSRLIERLPAGLRGRLTVDALLAPITWFRVGGAAEAMFRPADADDLAALLVGRPADVPVTVLGVASNLLVRDGGIEGVVVRLGRGFAGITVEEDHTVRVGAGALDLNVALACREAGIAGLEFLSGIPGTIGGGLRMNAGAYGAEIKDALVSAVALDPAGRRHELDAASLGLSYRHCGLPEDWIFVEAVLKGRRDAPEAIAARIAEIQAKREASQPVRARTGGSTFANPPGHKAWELIDRAGCRGLRRGGAMVSEKHTNFLINTGDATAADLEGLGEEVRRRVHETSGIALRWEIKRVGRPLPGLAAVADEEIAR